MPRLTEQDRTKIVAMRYAGASYRQIRIEIGCSLRSVQRWIDRYESGQPLSDEPRSGRPTVLTPAVKTSVTRFLKRTPSLRKCEAHLTSCGMTVSRGTIHSYASERLSKVKPRKAPQLNAQHIEKRLVFANTYLNKSKRFWRQVLYADEHAFDLHSLPEHVYVDKGSPPPRVPAPTHPKYLHLWGGFTSKGVATLTRLDEPLTSEIYTELLGKKIIPEVNKLLGKSWRLLHDSTSRGPHGSHETREWLSTHLSFFDPWPPNSPDLNPIENLWAIVNAQVKSLNPKSEEECWRALKDAWQKLDIVTLRNLCDSMPSRLQAVIDAQGGTIPY
jgi:transposase